MAQEVVAPAARLDLLVLEELVVEAVAQPVDWVDFVLVEEVAVPAARVAFALPAEVMDEEPAFWFVQL